jgi:hypothetical protein
VYNQLPLGKVLIQETTHGLWRFSQHIPSSNNGSDGIPQICTSIHGRFVYHHEKNTRQAPSKMETVLTRLRDAGLKVDAAKSLFCAHEIEYLGYILTREGIKPQPKKVQAILALKPPNNVKELRHFLGMVQYYRNMWARHSEMLAPLTDLVGE